MKNLQKTIKNTVSIAGRGLHSGLNVTLHFEPAPENHGIVFQRTDIEGQPFIKADAALVSDTSRGTTLKNNGVKIQTVEHCLAALTAYEIDNVLIKTDGEECPILDGSAKPYAGLIEEAGIKTQSEEKNYFELQETLTYKDEKSGVEFIAIPSDHYEIKTMVDFDSKVLKPQYAHMHHLHQFKDEFLDAKTFVFLHELEPLIKHNLIKGGDLENALVFVEHLISEEKLKWLADFFDKHDVKVEEQGILNNTDLKYQNEPARHKLLDVVGDLALVGRPLKAKIIATRPGHESNVAFGRIIKKHIKETEETSDIPHFTSDQEPVYDINDIKKMLPHRPPFLLVDKIMEVSDKHVIGMKNATMNEPFFVGHFPNEPVMPGVLQVEAMAQTGGILVLSTVPDPENYVTYFAKIDKVRFRKKVVPGDTIIFKLELIAPIRRGICQMQGTAYVGNKIVMEAELVAQIVKNS
ncbi:MAG: bifunctional UDP-3-O-[3-hydroxymyristoyl] N-acetylglucosamine deacetylase/3-hydroxyacyl-ACP dehydratase [Bacteroidota bacterium]